MKRLPKANMQTGKVKQNTLIAQASSLYTNMLANVTLFPTPPIMLTDFVDTINDYQSALAASQKKGKLATSTKNDAKKALIQQMQALIKYVNQEVQDQYATTPSANYSTLNTLALSSGAIVQKPVTRPNTLGSVKPTPVKHSIAKTPGKIGFNINGVLKIQVPIPVKFKVQAVKIWWLMYRTSAVGTTPAGTWQDFQSTSRIIKVSGLTAGLYDYQYAAVQGVFKGRNQLNWSQIQQTVVT